MGRPVRRKEGHRSPSGHRQPLGDEPRQHPPRRLKRRRLGRPRLQQQAHPKFGARRWAAARPNNRYAASVKHPCLGPAVEADSLAGGGASQRFSLRQGDCEELRRDKEPHTGGRPLPRGSRRLFIPSGRMDTGLRNGKKKHVEGPRLTLERRTS